MHAPIIIHIIYVTVDNIMYQQYVYCDGKRGYKQLSSLL